MTTNEHILFVGVTWLAPVSQGAKICATCGTEVSRDELSYERVNGALVPVHRIYCPPFDIRRVNVRPDDPGDTPK